MSDTVLFFKVFSLLMNDHADTLQLKYVRFVEMHGSDIC